MEVIEAHDVDLLRAGGGLDEARGEHGSLGWGREGKNKSCRAENGSGSCCALASGRRHESPGDRRKDRFVRNETIVSAHTVFKVNVQGIIAKPRVKILDQSRTNVAGCDAMPLTLTTSW